MSKTYNNSYQNKNLNTKKNYNINNTINKNINNNINNYNDNQKGNILFDNYNNSFIEINNHNNINNIPSPKKFNRINEIYQMNSTNQTINKLNPSSIRLINPMNQVNKNFYNPEKQLINNFNRTPPQCKYYQNPNNNNYKNNLQQTKLNNDLIPPLNSKNSHQIIETKKLIPQSQSQFEIKREYTSNKPLNQKKINQLQISPLKQMDYNMRVPKELNTDSNSQKKEIFKPFPIYFQQNEKKILNCNSNSNIFNNNKQRVVLHQTKKRRPLFKIPPSKKRSVSQGKSLNFINKYYDENFIMEEDNEEENLLEDKKNINTNNYIVNNTLRDNNRYKNIKTEYDISNLKNKIFSKTIGNNKKNIFIDTKNVENVSLINPMNKSKNVNESSEKYYNIKNIQDSENKEDIKISQSNIYKEMLHTVIGTNINLDSDVENESCGDDGIIILKKKKSENESNKYNTLNKIEKNANIAIEKVNNNIKEKVKKIQKYNSKTQKAPKKRKLFPECINTFSFNN